MDFVDIGAGIAVLVGLVGMVVPILPGLVLQVVAVTIWAFEKSTTTGWIVFGLVIGVALVATVFKYLFPGRRLKEGGIPGWLLFIAVLVGIVGLFVIPVVGGPLGFVLTIYLFERARHGKERAWPSTKTALTAVFQSMGIELGGGFIITVVYFIGALAT